LPPLRAEDAVEAIVVPASAAPLRTPDHSLAGESGTFERTLLGELRHIGVCLHTIRFGLREQFVDEEALR